MKSPRQPNTSEKGCLFAVIILLTRKQNDDIITMFPRTQNNTSKGEDKCSNLDQIMNRTGSKP